MREFRGTSTARHRGCLLLVAAVVLAFSSYIEQVVSMPALPVPNQWPTFPRRNIAALARAGYLRGGSAATFKRSISTLAKNGMLPTFRAPYDEADKQDDDEGESHEKRNMASIARLRSFSAMKRNIQALARDGYRGAGGRGQYTQQNDKRNVAALARNGMIHLHKKDVANGDEYYYPFYQNPVPPLSEIDGPFDANEMYDFQQSVNPDMFPPLSQVYKRGGPMPQNEYESVDESDYAGYGGPAEMDENWYLKRGSVGLPVLGMYRPTVGDQSTRTKRYILSLPDVIERNDIHDAENNDNENEDKRSVGSIPMTRISELGTNSQLDLRPNMPFYLFGLSGNVPAFTAIDNEIKPRNEVLEKTSHNPPPTLWLYEPSQGYAQRSQSTPVTEIVKMYYKTTEETKKFPRNEEESDRLLKVKPLINTLTTRKPDSTPPNTGLTSTKPIPTPPRLDVEALKSDTTTPKPEMTTKKSTTSPLQSSIMRLRIFKPKSIFMEWRPTKPNKNFFYRTLAASHRRKYIGHSYDPEMEIRTYHTLVHGKSERVPIRVWDATTKAKEPTETSEDENAYRNIMYF